jgi:hypothetical protein
MARSIVAESLPFPDGITGVAHSSSCFYETYTGEVEALVAAGIIAEAQLVPQRGRAWGYTAFYASGDPCPPGVLGHRLPGFKQIREQEGGGVRVDITVSTELQRQRRKPSGRSLAAKASVSQSASTLDAARNDSVLQALLSNAATSQPVEPAPDAE